MPAEIPSNQLPAQASPQSTGGSDDFGYTWDDSIPFNWIDVTNGTDTGLGGYSYDLATDLIPIPFPFKFYDNTYDEVYITAAGYLSFSEADYWEDQSEIPSPSEPNNVIAPYWTPIFIDSASWVHYLSGGSAPNRYFVVEWHDVNGGEPEDTIGGDDTYRFEVILHENGDIVFQYQTMSYNASDGYWCGVAGIEDDRGLDGLTYVDFCDTAPSKKAVRFLRPPPAARLRIDPLYGGNFVNAGETTSFSVPIKNTGELGSDTFDLFPGSDAWPWILTSESGDPLSDTNSNGIVDTGPVNQGSMATVIFQVLTPDAAQDGDSNQASLTARSSLDPNKSKTASFSTAIPAPFVQVYKDTANEAMSLSLAQPAGQVLKKVTEDDYYGYGTAVAETLDGFAYFWYRYTGSGSEIEYTLLDRYGEKAREVSRLTHDTGSNIYNYEPAVDVTSNGHIGVIWSHEIYNEDYTQYNYNVYFAILDNEGNPIYGPANLTQNDIWGSWTDFGIPEFYDVRIAATTDNRFMLAWTRYQEESEGGVEDIFITIRGSSGNEIKPITNLTNDTPGWDREYYAPTLTGLDANNVLLAYSQWEDYGTTGIVYTVLSSNGNLVYPLTELDDTTGSNLDAVELSSGRVVIAWTSWEASLPEIVCAILSPSYQLATGPMAIYNPAALTGDRYVSLTADAEDRAILTWTDSDSAFRRHLYYALLKGNGTFLGKPMLIQTSPQIINMNYDGYGNTSYSWSPPEGVDGFAEFKGEAFNAPPGGIAAVKVYVSNYGATQATNVALTATLDNGLTYLSDTSGITPTQIGNQLTWNLPDMDLLDYLNFIVYVELIPGADFGSTYPLTLTLVSDGSDIDPDNNLDSAAVVAVRQLFLPVTRNDYR